VLEGGDLDAVTPHAAALDHWLALGGADVEARMAAAIAELGLRADDLDRPLGTLSGGQAARAGLAAIALARFDVVLLDEPTNHLDADGLRRLTRLLADHSGAIVIASHDRALLADAVSDTVELDRRTGQATHYHGGWTTYVRDNDKSSREWVMMRAEEMTGRARKMGGRGRRIEVPDAPWQSPALRLHLTAAEQRGGWVVALDGVVVRRRDWSLGPLEFAVTHGERVLVSGPNGSGKSTLLSALAGRLPLTEGRRRAAPGAVVAQLGQAREALTGDATLVDQVRQLTRLGEPSARTALASFGISAEIALQCVATLSPGELTRAGLTVLAHDGPPACSSMSRPIIWTSSPWRCSKRHWRTGPGHWSSPPTTGSYATDCDSIASSRYLHLDPQTLTEPRR
jgi:ATPase subunit of ABC transporter with duplicated ATPase domains